MAANALFIGWTRAVSGREKEARGAFEEVMSYLEARKGAGEIDDYDTILLSPHGGDLNGFILVRGDPARLAALRLSAPWEEQATRALILTEGFRIIEATSADETQRRVERSFQHL